MEKSDQKPSVKLFTEAVTWVWDKNSSYFVGDALGRRGDWSDSDKVFAENVGFKTIKAPEDIFPYKNNKSTIKITPAKQQEVVIMIGYPGSGKSSIAQDILGVAGYEVLSGDELKTSVKMIKKAENILQKDKRSVVFDATNPSKKKRAEYITFATKWNLPVRCIHVATNLEESMARNQKRPTDKIVPRIAYNLYKKNFEEPTKDEGCEIIKIE
jgi:bifunctional polynucleotide phosphatase/kinase